MELKLNIYEKKKIVKTYTAETYDLMFGTVEDFIEIINLDKLTSGSDVEIIQLFGRAVIDSLDIIKPLLKDVFEGLTDEELRNTKTSEIVNVLVNIVRFAISELNQGSNEKN